MLVVGRVWQLVVGVMCMVMVVVLAGGHEVVHVVSPRTGRITGSHHEGSGRRGGCRGSCRFGLSRAVAFAKMDGTVHVELACSTTCCPRILITKQRARIVQTRCIGLV